MKHVQPACVFAFGPVLGLLFVLAMGAADRNSEVRSVETTSAPQASQKAPSGKTVPLESVYSTSAQKGLIRLPSKKNKELDSVFEDLYRDMRGVGASNVFLAQGDDIDTAVLASWEVYVAWQSCDTPARTGQSKKSEKYWLVAYLGIAPSTAVAWVVKSVEVNDKTIRLKYLKGGKATSTDRRQYHVWAPLGTMAAGSYQLELFDEDSGHVAMSRRVTISGKK